MAEKQSTVDSEISVEEYVEVTAKKVECPAMRSVIDPPSRHDIKYINGIPHRQDPTGKWRPVISIDENDS